MSLTKIILTEAISDEQLVEKVVNIIESKLNFNLSFTDAAFQFKGQGAYAEVFEIDESPNRVIRIEPEPYESFWSDVVGLNLPNVVKVYYSDTIRVKFKLGIRELDITIMEKLEPLPEDVRQEAYSIASGLPFSERYDRRLANAFIGYPKTKKLGRDILKGIDQLESNSIYLNDLHMGNVMYDPKKDVYKIIDLSNT